MRALRVLHVLGNLGRGGAETWFAQVVQHFDRQQVQTDVLLNGQPDGPHRTAVDRAGCRVFVGGAHANPLRYRRQFLSILRTNGPYDVVHAHLQFFNGFIMKLACEGGVRVRIAHCRSSSDGKKTTLTSWVYRAWMRRWLKYYASCRLAVSREAALATFGLTWGGKAHCSIVTGIDVSPFRAVVDRDQVRHALGISSSKYIIGHVGSFRAVKNHEFLLRIGSAMAQRRSDVLFLLVGDGPLREPMVRRVTDSGFAKCFLFTGDRPDVPRLMLGAMNAFCFPSIYEGMPRALLEAQAAGLPCVASSTITREAAADPDLIQFVGLAEPVEKWCDALEKTLGTFQENSRVAALKELERRGLTIEANARCLTALYRDLKSQCLP